MKALVSVKENSKIMNFVLDVVHIKVTKLETVTEHAKTDYQTVPAVHLIMLQIKSTCI